MVEAHMLVLLYYTVYGKIINARFYHGSYLLESVLDRYWADTRFIVWRIQSLDISKTDPSVLPSGKSCHYLSSPEFARALSQPNLPASQTE